MQDIVAGFDWRGDECCVLGLRYQHSESRVLLEGGEIGLAANRAAAEVLIRADASARVFGVLTEAAQRALQGVARARHKKRGSFYRVLGQGRLQSGRPLEDDAALVIYRAEEGGALWARPVDEFQDGRFDLDPGPSD